MAEFVGVLLGILFAGVAFAFYAWLFYFLPAKMAKKRGRSVAGWVLIFLILTPIWGIILLSILGDSSEKIKKDIINELTNKSPNEQS